MKVKEGIYRHYKGKKYKVIGVARHSETEEEVVVYQCLYGDYSLWVRPLSMFTETIKTPEGEKQRFEYIPNER